MSPSDLEGLEHIGVGRYVGNDQMSDKDGNPMTIDFDATVSVYWGRSIGYLFRFEATWLKQATMLRTFRIPTLGTDPPPSTFDAEGEIIRHTIEHLKERL